MAAAFHVLAVVAVLVAIGAWGVAVYLGIEALRANRARGLANPPSAFALLVAWPFAVRGPAAESERHAVRAGKAAVAFFVALTLCVAAISAYTNLTMKRPSSAPSGHAPGAAAPAPSKS